MSTNSIHKQGFERRFNIEVGLEIAQQRFVARVFNLIDEAFLGFTTKQCHLTEYANAFKYVAYKLGVRYDGNNTLAYYSGDEFPQVLRALEALFQGFIRNPHGYNAKDLDKIIKLAISESEIDLGIQWRDGLFYPSGAELLDDELVNAPMDWLDDPKYKNVLAPFKKGLAHYMEAGKNPNKLADTVTDMYEAIEALAKIVTHRPKKDLSANAELFVKTLKMSEYYNKMLGDYINYANQYRHGVEQAKTRTNPRPHEVEAFIYLTGLFIRCVIKQVGIK